MQVVNRRQPKWEKVSDCISANYSFGVDTRASISLLGRDVRKSVNVNRGLNAS